MYDSTCLAEAAGLRGAAGRGSSCPTGTPAVVLPASPQQMLPAGGVAGPGQRRGLPALPAAEGRPGAGCRSGAARSRCTHAGGWDRCKLYQQQQQLQLQRDCAAKGKESGLGRSASRCRTRSSCKASLQSSQALARCSRGMLDALRAPWQPAPVSSTPPQPQQPRPPCSRVALQPIPRMAERQGVLPEYGRQATRWCRWHAWYAGWTAACACVQQGEQEVGCGAQRAATLATGLGRAATAPRPPRAADSAPRQRSQARLGSSC